MPDLRGIVNKLPTTKGEEWLLSLFHPDSPSGGIKQGIFKLPDPNLDAAPR